MDHIYMSVIRYYSAKTKAVIFQAENQLQGSQIKWIYSNNVYVICIKIQGLHKTVEN